MLQTYCSCALDVDLGAAKANNDSCYFYLNGVKSTTRKKNIHFLRRTQNFLSIHM